MSKGKKGKSEKGSGTMSADKNALFLTFLRVIPFSLSTFHPFTLSHFVPLTLLLLVASLSACERKSIEQVETEAPVPVTVETAKVESIRSTIAAGGLVVPAAGAELTIVAPAQGRVAEITRAEGEAVRQGDVLVRFDIPSMESDVAAKRAAVAQASARVEAAKAAYTRLSGLVTQGVAAPREVEDAKRQQAEAEADLQQARTAVDAAAAIAERVVVRARFSGVVAKRFHNPGDLVDASASDPVLKVINPSQLQVSAAVPVADLPRVVVGHQANVTAPGSETPEPAKVLTRAAQVDPNSATADVRLAFAKPTRLAAGTVVQVSILGEEHPSAVVISSGAIVRDEGETFVMVAGDDKKAHKYPIAIGLTTHDKVEITNGLKAGDKVIVHGQEELPEGAAVNIQ
jgi:RND family efflux transporter MFP subunit